MKLVQGDYLLESSTAQGYVACFQRARELSPYIPRSNLDFTASGIEFLILDYLDPLATSSLDKSGSELLSLSIEAVFTLWTFLKLGENRVPDKPSISKNSSSQILNIQCLIDVVGDILLDGPKIPPTWQQRGTPIKPCLIRILLWVWENRPETPINRSQKDNMFVSSCRLLVPLEQEVAFSKSREFEEDEKPLTPDDLNRIVEFIECIRQERNDSDFISRNADVDINRLYVHFGQQADWEYKLFEMREKRTLCCQPNFKENLLL